VVNCYSKRTKRKKDKNRALPIALDTSFTSHDDLDDIHKS
jgi:hypothetical protein